MNIDNKLVSIIVPIYNIEKYLPHCINSILNQTYKNFELILVNDGSKDASGDVCDEYKELDSRIKVIHKINSGVSDARNCALRIAKGKYVLFVDGDDWIDNDLLNHYIMKIEKQSADLLISEYNSHINGQCIPQDPDHLSGIINIDEAYLKIINPKGFYGSVWGKLFTLEIIKKNNLQFDSDIRIGEDLLFTVNYLNYCNSVVYDCIGKYNYLIREGSALNNEDFYFDEKRLDIIKVYEKIMKHPNFNKSSYKNRVYSIYVRECADWYCRTNNLKEYSKYKNLRQKSLKNLICFLYSDTYTVQTKVNTLLKLITPKLVNKLKYSE